jgi:DNA-binding PadR family transcriptional regulator
MAVSVDPAVSALFGSETRVRALAPLANSQRPLTGYRVARMMGIPRTKIYSELTRLESEGWVTRSLDGRGRAVWTLNDPDVRRLLRRRVRVVLADEAFSGSVELASKTRQVMQSLRLNPVDRRLLDGPFTPANPRDYDRPPTKDAALRCLRLPVSRRTRRPR